MFISGLWQIHTFGEGTIKTTAVFFIKHLRTLGYDVTNDIFAKHSWYFRNALVLANYTDLKNGIHSTTEYLELFLENLLLNKHHKLLNRTMHIANTLKAKLDIQISWICQDSDVKDFFFKITTPKKELLDTELYMDRLKEIDPEKYKEEIPF